MSDALIQKYTLLGDANKLAQVIGSDTPKLKQFYMGRTSLHAAAQKTSGKVLQLLLTSCKDSIPIEDVDGKTCLFYAVTSGHASNVKMMIEAGADINHQDHFGRTPLYWAVKEGNDEMVELLLSLGADPTVTTNLNESPLDHAIYHKNETAAVLLSQKTQAENDPTLAKRHDVSQDVLNKKLIDYCKKKNFTEHFIDESGCCHGWSFLFQYYHALGKEEEFHAIREYLSQWDGDLEHLQDNDNLPKILKDKKYSNGVLIYPNGEKLLELLINDLTWFQNTTVTHLSGGLQADRLKQWNMLEDSKMSFQEVFNSHNIRFTESEANSHLKSLSKLNDIWFDLGIVIIDKETNEAVFSHAVSVKKLPNGKYRYFDSNYLFKDTREYDSIDDILNMVQKSSDICAQDFDVKYERKVIFSTYRFNAQQSIVPPLESVVLNFDSLSEKDKKRLMYTTIKNNKLNTMSILLESNIDLNMTFNSGLSPLRMAIEQQADGIALLLIKNKANLNELDSSGNTLLHTACKQGAISVVNALLEEQADPNIANSHGMKPIHLAAKIGNISIVQSLINSDIPLDLTDNLNNTPLHYAITSNSVDLIDYLISTGADINAQNNLGETPLLQAIQANNILMLEKLLLLKADIHIKGHNGLNALQLALAKNNLQVLEILLKHEPNLVNKPDPKGVTLLQKAIISKNHAAANILIASGAELKVKDASHNTLLHYAAHVHDVEMMFNLIKLGLNPFEENASGNKPALYTDQNRNTLLHYAVKYNKTEMIEILAQNKALLDHPNLSNQTALHYAAQEGRLDCIKILKKAGASFDCKDSLNENLLHYAVKSGNIELIRYLVKQGVPINGANLQNETPLHLAVKLGQEEAVKTLLDLGADINHKNTSGHTPLMVSTTLLHPNILNILANHPEVGLNEVCFQGKTAIQYAIEHNNAYAAVALINGGADVTVVTPTNDTLLHLSAYYLSDPVVINRLLSKNLDINQPNQSGMTALHYAIMQGKPNIIEALQANGAKIDQANSLGITPYKQAISTKNPAIICATSGVIAPKTPGTVFYPVHEAVKQNSLHAVVALRNIGLSLSDLNQAGESPLLIALKEGNLQMVNALIRLGADVKDIDKRDRFGESPLFIAARSANIELLTKLLELGANTKMRNNLGQSIIDVLGEENCKEIVQLLSTNVNIDEPNEYGQTALLNALSDNKTNLALALIDVGADITVKSEDNETTLFLAAEAGNLILLKHLIAKGIDINEPNSDGLTPLAIAIKEENLKAIELLIKKGATIDLKDNQGKTPLHHAARTDNPKIIDLLIQHGANPKKKDKKSRTPLLYSKQHNCNNAENIFNHQATHQPRTRRTQQTASSSRRRRQK